MGKRRVLPTTAIINAFNALSTSEQEIVFDYIRSQAMVSRPKSTASGASERSSRRSSKATSTANTEARQASAIAASGD